MGNHTKKTQLTTPQGDLRKGQFLELVITSLNHDGLGTALHEGKTINVAGTLPGERVRVRIDFVGRMRISARLKQVLLPVPGRRPAPASNHGGLSECCPLIMMQEAEQRTWKGELVAREIHSYRSLAQTVVQPPLPSPEQLGYRTTAKLVFGDKFLSPLIGIYRRHSHDVLDISDCPLHHPLINRIAQATKEGIKKGKVTIYNPRTGFGLLRYLVIRVSLMENRAMVVFVTTERSFNEIHHLAKHIQKIVPEISVVAQNLNNSEGNVVLGECTHFLTKKKTLLEQVGPIRLNISPLSFFQVNTRGAELLYTTVREKAALRGQETVLDLYCGVGGIALFLAAAAKDVLGVEIVRTAVDDATRNARLNGIHNCQFEAGNVLELLKDMGEEGKTIDLIVLNPPRSGCEKRVLQGAAALGPKKMVYVSCSPSSLARDLDILAQLGYSTQEIQPVDMFPQTPHVENVALLVRQQAHP